MPVCAIALLLAHPLLPNSRDRGARSLDPTGTALGILALTTLVYGIISAPHHGWSSPATVSVLLLGMALFVLYARRERQLPVPSLPLDLLRTPRYAGAVAVIVLFFFTVAGMSFVIALYLQAVLGCTPLQAGLRILPFAGAAAAGSGCVLLVPVRFGPRPPVVSGAAMALVGYLVLASTTPDSGYGRTLAALLLIGTGLGLAAMPCTEIVMNAADPDHAGTAAATNDTTRAVGSSLGIAVLGSVVNSVYTDRMEHHGPQLPAGAARMASEQAVGALTAASQLPPDQAARLIAAAREAYVHAMTVAALPAAGATTAAGLAAWFLLRRPGVTAPVPTKAPEPTHLVAKEPAV